MPIVFFVFHFSTRWADLMTIVVLKDFIFAAVSYHAECKVDNSVVHFFGFHLHIKTVLAVKVDIPLKLPVGTIMWSELTRGEQLAFGHASLPAIELGNTTRREIEEYFARVNFAGVAQSMEHKEHIHSLLKSLSG